jgi:hypothetical protein
LAHLKETGEEGPNLIIVPSSTMGRNCISATVNHLSFWLFGLTFHLKYPLMFVLYWLIKELGLKWKFHQTLCNLSTGFLTWKWCYKNDCNFFLLFGRQLEEGVEHLVPISERVELLRQPERAIPDENWYP